MSSSLSKCWGGGEGGRGASHVRKSQQVTALHVGSVFLACCLDHLVSHWQRPVQSTHLVSHWQQPIQSSLPIGPLVTRQQESAKWPLQVSTRCNIAHKSPCCGWMHAKLMCYAIAPRVLRLKLVDSARVAAWRLLFPEQTSFLRTASIKLHHPAHS